jgi:hypothetical protein
MKKKKTIPIQNPESCCIAYGTVNSTDNQEEQAVGSRRLSITVLFIYKN